MSFSIGIVGLPNVGKSTLFKSITKKQVDVANYPFCTIDPNVGVVEVPDERFDKLCQILNSSKKIPTTIEFVDIAGLVRGASAGEGLGNQFLAHIREVDAILQVVRDFHDENIIHVHGQINPVEDEAVIATELILADLETMIKRVVRAEKIARSNNKDAQACLFFYQKIKKLLEQGQSIRQLDLETEEQKWLRELQLLSNKPMLVVKNVDEKELGKDELSICAKIEAELAELSDKEATVYRAELGLPQSGLDRIIIASYNLLDLITFFTASYGGIAQAWTVKRGTLAPQAAGVIHSDFEAGFIRAEVISWQDLADCGSESSARDKGLIRTEGKTYPIHDGDVVHFLFAK